MPPRLRSFHLARVSGARAQLPWACSSLLPPTPTARPGNVCPLLPPVCDPGLTAGLPGAGVSAGQRGRSPAAFLVRSDLSLREGGREGGNLHKLRLPSATRDFQAPGASVCWRALAGHRRQASSFTRCFAGNADFVLHPVSH